MNKEEIKAMIKDCVYSEDGITYMSDKQYNNYINTIEQLQQENQELKKQVDYLRRSIERKEETIIDLQNERVPYTNKYVYKLENQQQEFIEWLENETNIYPYDISDYVYEDIINTILSKYEDIIEK